jgi:hypothetical protein
MAAIIAWILTHVMVNHTKAVMTEDSHKEQQPASRQVARPNATIGKPEKGARSAQDTRESTDLGGITTHLDRQYQNAGMLKHFPV